MEETPELKKAYETANGILTSYITLLEWFRAEGMYLTTETAREKDIEKVLRIFRYSRGVMEGCADILDRDHAKNQQTSN